MNSITLIGNLVRDPETKAVGEKSVCRFTIAVDRPYIAANGERETDYFDISAWDKLGQNCSKFLTKGKKVAILGSVYFKEYTDKDGIKRKATNINASNVEFLSSAKKAEEVETKDDLPF